MFNRGPALGIRYHRDNPRLATHGQGVPGRGGRDTMTIRHLRPSTVGAVLAVGRKADKLAGGQVIGEAVGGHMTDGQSRRGGENRGPAAVEVRVAAQLENLAVLRTVVGAIGTFSDLDFDSVADLRLAVDEACTRLIRSATPDATLVVVVDPREDVVVVEASTTCDTYDVVTEGSFSWHVLSSLTDRVETFHNGHDPSPDGLVFGITLTTRRAGLAQ